MFAQRRVLCYGDSNTHGADPETRLRLGPEIRWPGVLQRALGDAVTVIEEGLNGRTTTINDPIEPHRNGLTYLAPCLMSHDPLDLVALMLGTNNLKRRFGLSASEIATSVEQLIRLIQTLDYRSGQTPDILLIAPPLVAETTAFEDQFAGAHEKSKGMAAAYAEVADRLGCHFLDAAAILAASPADGLHLDAAAHTALGEAVATKVRETIAP